MERRQRRHLRLPDKTAFHYRQPRSRDTPLSDALPDFPCPV